MSKKVVTVQIDDDGSVKIIFYTDPSKIPADGWMQIHKVAEQMLAEYRRKVAN